MRRMKQMKTDIDDFEKMRKYGGILSGHLHSLSKGEIQQDVEKLQISTDHASYIDGEGSSNGDGNVNNGELSPNRPQSQADEL